MGMQLLGRPFPRQVSLWLAHEFKPETEPVIRGNIPPIHRR